MDQGNHLKKVPFILVTGFLGSGKTSLLLDLVRKYSDQIRIAIVQNEFAPGHVDGFTLKQSDKPFELLEINNGSVFCACLLGDFITRLAPFIDDHQPDLILLEATGLADPVSLGQVLQAPELADKIFLAGSWCLVDALNFHRIIGSISRARHQVRIADIVWINKTDLVSDTGAIRAMILEMNPFARIIETTFGATDELTSPFPPSPPPRGQALRKEGVAPREISFPATDNRHPTTDNRSHEPQNLPPHHRPRRRCSSRFPDDPQQLFTR